MKKEEKQQLYLMKDVRKYNDQRSRSYSPKAYHGCDTCKNNNMLKNSDLKKNKSISKFSDYTCHLDKNKINKYKKNSQEGEKDIKEELKKGKIKLTELCDDDKKRIVELIEELSRFADRNKKLKETLDRLQKTRQELQDYIMKQTNLHLEEKDFYVKEINEYKCKLEFAENQMKNKVLQWEKHERFMDTEIAYFAKALQDSVTEKNDLNEQMNHLKSCLRQLLHSFQRLRNDIRELQNQEKVKQMKSVSCQTEIKSVKFKMNNCTKDELDEELSLQNQNTMEAKSSLDVINDKLEYVYQLLKRKSENLAEYSPKKYDMDLTILLKNGNLTEEEKNLINLCQEEMLKGREEVRNTGYKFLKPLMHCSKTSIQAERILKKIEKPLGLSIKKLSNLTKNFEIKQYDDKPMQRNNLFLSTNDFESKEDKLLEDLFYNDGNMGPEFTMYDNSIKKSRKHF